MREGRLGGRQSSLRLLLRILLVGSEKKALGIDELGGRRGRRGGGLKGVGVGVMGVGGVRGVVFGAAASSWVESDLREGILGLGARMRRRRGGMGETVLEGKVLRIDECVEAAELKASASAALAVVSGGAGVSTEIRRRISSAKLPAPAPPHRLRRR